MLEGVGRREGGGRIENTNDGWMTMKNTFNWCGSIFWDLIRLIEPIRKSLKSLLSKEICRFKASCRCFEFHYNYWLYLLFPLFSTLQCALKRKFDTFQFDFKLEINSLLQMRFLRSVFCRFLFYFDTPYMNITWQQTRPNTLSHRLRQVARNIIIDVDERESCNVSLTSLVWHWKRKRKKSECKNQSRTHKNDEYENHTMSESN